MAELTDLEKALKAIGTKEENYDLSGFAENPSGRFSITQDSIPVLRHITGLEKFDATGIAKYDLNADGVVDQLDLDAGMQNNVGLDPNVANTGLYKEFADQNTNLDTQLGNLSTSVGTQSGDPNVDNTGLYKQFADQNQNLTTQFEGLNLGVGTQSNDPAVDNTGLYKQFADQNTNLTTQFGNLTNRFDTVDTNVGANLAAIGDVGGQVTGVSGQVTGVQDTANTIDTNTQGLGKDIADLSTAQTGRFDTLDQGFMDTQGQLTDAEAEVLKGQKGLDDALTTMSNDNEITSTEMLKNQTTMQEGQDGFVSNFDDYVTRYGEDVNLANKFRTDLGQAQTNAFDQIRTDVGGFANNNALNTSLPAPPSNIRTNQPTSVPAGFNAQNGTLGAKSRELANMVSQVQSLNPTQRQDLQSVISAFDPQGNLVKSSFRKNGMTTLRAIDSSGNLIMRDFEPSGREVANKVISIPDQLAFLSQYGTLPQANVGMGNLSPAVNTNSSGYVSPYATTR